MHPVRRTPLQGNGKRETFLTRDTLFTLLRDGIVHVVSENYDYKTEPYYTILNYESQGIEVRPSSRAVLDAYVVPICLERAERAGIRVCEWGISQGYVPLPAIIYGLNYFATTSDLFLVRDAMNAREVIKHVTNKGKYPFCYQKLPEEREIHTCPAIFGKTVKSCSRVADIADRIYDIFGIPLVRMTMVRTGNEFALSSLSPMPYSQMSEGERSVLSAHLRHQEFL
ncbi:MAG: RimK-like ATPgrasp N-terminal domain-containing protein [Methanoregula sp.]|nr:RimK-like ATPgrasp N-terminal domain-containing protein [Methanoregula sp.]